MSKLRRIPDVERTATMLDLLRRSYEGDGTGHAMSRAYVVVEEVAPGTGFSSAQRWADVLALSVWPSNGLTLDGFEIKASRTDLKKELSDPSKHQAIARYCDTWTLLAWDEGVLTDGIPEDWGITTTVDGEHGRKLATQRKAAKREPDAWSRNFVCSLVRNAAEQSPGAAYVARVCTATLDRARGEFERAKSDEIRRALRPLARAIYGDNDWKWPAEAHDADALVRNAAERLKQGSLFVGGAA